MALFALAATSRLALAALKCRNVRVGRNRLQPGRSSGLETFTNVVTATAGVVAWVILGFGQTDTHNHRQLIVATLTLVLLEGAVLAGSFVGTLLHNRRIDARHAAGAELIPTAGDA
jgi:hypothetical protein